MRIAILEDDAEQAQHISLWLSTAGHTSEIYGTASDFKKGILNTEYDLYIIDWELPDTNGDVVLDWLRNDLKSDILVLFCTAHDDEEDIVKILQLGADDYMVKPINPLELLARINALARRLPGFKNHPTSLTVNNLSLELDRRTAAVDNVPCNLTPKEFDLAVYLLQHLGSLVSREELLKSIWSIKANIDSRTVDTHISRLRKKLQLVENKGWDLNVVYQYGYRLDKVEPVAAK